MKRQISPVAAAVAAVIFLGVVIFVYAKMSTPTSPLPGSQSSASKGPGDFFAQKAKECGGDFSRLSAQDQQQIQAMTGGKGAETMRQMFQQK